MGEQQQQQHHRSVVNVGRSRFALLSAGRAIIKPCSRLGAVNGSRGGSTRWKLKAVSSGGRKRAERERERVGVCSTRSFLTIRDAACETRSGRARFRFHHRKNSRGRSRGCRFLISSRCSASEYNVRHSFARTLLPRVSGAKRVGEERGKYLFATRQISAFGFPEPGISFRG